jgi:hypothetical protein
MTERERIAPERAELNGGGGGRRDYGPKGCAGIVYHAVVVTTLLRLLLKAVR